MEHDEFAHMGVVYEMDFDMTSYDRRIYTALDWLSDVGGLSGALFSAVGILAGLLTANDMHWYLIENIFRRKQLDPSADKAESSSNSDNEPEQEQQESP